MILKLLYLLIVIGFSFLSSRYYNYCGVMNIDGERRDFVRCDKETAVLYLILAFLFGLILIFNNV